jgi:hypothetical protein
MCRADKKPFAAPATVADACRRLHEEEAGMVTIVSIVVILLFLLLANLVWNIGWTTTTKMKVQNGADAASYSSALWMARGLNAVTATNHLMGEMQAFVVIHSALGEKHPKRKEHTSPPLSNASFPKSIGDAADQVDRFQGAKNLLVDTAYPLAQKLSQIPFFALDYMKGKPEIDGGEIQMGSTISDGRYYIMKVMTAEYFLRAVAGVLEKVPFPPITALGYAIDGICIGVEVILLVEWYVLYGLEEVYTGSKEFANALREKALPFAQKFEGLVAKAIPAVAAAAGPKIAQDNGCKDGFVYPTIPQLKYQFTDDPWGVRGQEEGADDFMRKSQLVRATYPWVKYHRRPLLDILNFCKFSNSAYNLVFWTNDYSLLKSRDLYRDQGCYMLVLEGSDPSNKGREAWTTDPDVLESRFAIIGFAYKSQPGYSVPRLLGKPIPKGMVAYSMALVYNANFTDERSGDEFQPDWGWDTLNWELPARNSFASELPAEPDPIRNGHSETPGQSHRPLVKLNWQAKLTPASSYLNEAIVRTTWAHKDMLEKLPALPPAVRAEFQHH